METHVRAHHIVPPLNFLGYFYGFLGLRECINGINVMAKVKTCEWQTLFSQLFCVV